MAKTDFMKTSTSLRPVSKIASLRQKANLTQLQLAQAVGVTESTIANWEKGRSVIDLIAKLIKLCRKLNCNLEQLIDYEPDTKEKALSVDDIKNQSKTKGKPQAVINNNST